MQACMQKTVRYHLYTALSRNEEIRSISEVMAERFGHLEEIRSISELMAEAFPKMQRRHSMRIERDKTAALIIDYQERLVPAMDQKERLIENSGILLAGLNELEIPMYITQQYTRGLGMTVPEITSASGQEEYVEKISFSAYEEVKQYITGKKYIIVCGIEAHICVLQTVIDLRAAGYIPVLVTDCITSRRESDKLGAVERAKEEGALTTTYEALLFELLKEAGTPLSKKIQRLIK